MILLSCSNGVLGSVIFIFKNLLNIIWIAGPILAIISLIINFTVMISNPKDKKVLSKIKNSFIALVVLFFIPTFINITMKLVSDTEIGSCWNQSNSRFSSNTIYVNPYSDREKQKIVNDSSDYEPGTRNDNSNNNNYNDNYKDSSCGSLEYCNKFLTSMVNNSKRLNDAIIKNNVSARFYWDKNIKTWEQIINVAESGKTVTSTCSKPTNWGLYDVIGDHKTVNSVNPGGFRHYYGLIAEYTKQYKYNGSMSLKTAIKKGLIAPGDIVGFHKHTITIYSVNQNDGSAVVFDGGHRYSNRCRSQRKCSIMFTYSPSTNASLKVLQVLRWVK